ncbi:MAG: heparan-alpha-glucosaminide N-acetyltransferase domain-containing protein [Acinetobacter populi]|jgi:uncharacterized membrane protein|uniref:DUF1624 domain-containing protein n=1 Tax=Acinetobacter populi TaxID=1582270 RepID=UPI002357CC97|nr:heparan-alpha-glucosaminide N-acetyltransferase domain-containing protein [Acinetobacter populi]MCH4246757.1 heparan-alpha-glucosaminide N-acetyltransferase domain-containing protein [Acinetobacter populi]
MPIEKTASRLQMIDALRGLVIIFMMLDHVRETFYLYHQVSDPVDIAHTEPALFWSRMLSHLCAPIFVVLTGLSAYLYQQKRQNLQQTREFLLKRGLFLIVLELTLVNFAWTAQFPPQVIYLQVIWAIGLSMVALACLIGLPLRIQLALSLLIIFGHNLLDQITFSQPFLQNIWHVLHQRGWIEFGEDLKVRTSYPVLPWIGVILFGYVLGHLFNQKIAPVKRNQYLIMIGSGSIALFIVLRLLNFYGDQPWLEMNTWQQTLMSFFNLTKYPPSLLFLLWNVGLGILILVAFDRYSKLKIMQPLVVFGSVPMFFYLLHLYVLKILYVICVMWFGTNYGEYFGVSSVAILWILTAIFCVLLYPVVKAFSQYKHSHPEIKILKYF